ncbi:MAG: D-alanyl-D-alanine carboxypeptidase family protein [Oscillospiraceae bacterium]|nr:D-alanyl-D-alanine carboxypeptidase family protein [Oscillospiraceae bacterium]
MKRFIALMAATIIVCGCQARSIPAASEVSMPESEPSSAVSETPSAKESEPAESVSEPASEPESAPEESAPGESAPEESEQPLPESPAAGSLEGDWRLVLVNPWTVLEEEMNVDLVMTKYGYKVDARIEEDLDDMISSAKADGVDLLVCYGYRTFAQSQQLFEKQINRQKAANPHYTHEQAVEAAKRWVAPPGTSDHHTGLALDIVTPSNQVLDDNFATTDAAKWMAAHGWEYGFVLRFPKDKTEITGIAYESWHMRYVGREHAAIMQENNYCLEEYIEALNLKGE